MANHSSGKIRSNNLRLLEKKFPIVYGQWERSRDRSSLSLRPFRTRQGQPNAVATLVNGERIVFYKGDDIFAQSRKMMDAWDLDTPDILFCVGFGLGYTPLMAAQQCAAKPEIVVIEPSIEIFAFAMSVVDLTALFAYDRLSLFIGGQSTAAGIANHYDFHLFLGKQRVVTHAPSRSILGDPFRNLEREFKDQIGLKRDLWHTNQQIGTQMVTNTMTNLPSLVSSVPIETVRGSLSGTPAICVAAGPSLDKAIPILQSIRDRVLIVAMDSAVSTLSRTGIAPHMVVTCDARKENIEKLRPYLHTLRDSILIFALESNPDNVRLFPGAKRVVVTGVNSIAQHWILPEFQFDCRLPAISTVSHTAVFSLLSLGADPIILVGMDMAFPTEQSHSTHAVNRYNLHSAQLVEVSGMKGLPVHTYRPLIDYKRQLEDVIRTTPQRIINTSIDGVHIRGTQNKSIGEVIETELMKDVSFKRKIEKISWGRSHSHQTVRRALEGLRGRIESMNDHCRIEITKIEELVSDEGRGNRCGQWETKVTKIKECHDHFSCVYADIIDILFMIRLEKVKQMEIRRMACQHLPASDGQGRLEEELRILMDNYSSLREAADFFLGLVQQQASYYRNIPSTDEQRESGGDTYQKKKELAEFFSKAGEIASAERLYREMIGENPNDPHSWLRLGDMYAQKSMWAPAREHIRDACLRFPDDMDMETQRKFIEKKISGIMVTIQEAWTAGDKETTRKLLAEYLLFFPEDRQARLLADVLHELEATLAADSSASRETSGCRLPIHGFLDTAGNYIARLRFDRAIGILEGAIEHFPQQKTILREKIGDCRMLQQDYKSALYNFGQAMRMGSQGDRIRSKIEKARKGVETAPVP